MTDLDLMKQTREEGEKLLESAPYQALPLLRQAAHWGDLESQKMLSEIYTNGLFGVMPNPQAAFEYTRMAALNNDPKMTFKLATLFLDGKGCEKSPEKALYFARKAAEFNADKADDFISVIYMMGWGTPRDLEQAEIWNRKALKKNAEDEQALRHQTMISRLLEKEKKQQEEKK